MIFSGKVSDIFNLLVKYKLQFHDHKELTANFEYYKIQQDKMGCFRVSGLITIMIKLFLTLFINFLPGDLKKNI